jgi:hypothetical protein
MNMFFSRNKEPDRVEVKDEATILTPGVKEKVAAFIQHSRDTAAGKNPTPVFTDAAPLQLLTDADVAFFVAAMEAEAARIDDEAEALSRQRIADIAAKDAQIAALNREIESKKAVTTAQDAEISRRAEALVGIQQVAKRIAPGAAVDNLNETQIKAAVVRARFGDQAVSGHPQAYIDSRFDFLADAANVDPFRSAMKDGPAPNLLDAKAAADRAYRDMVADLTASHKSDQTKH